MGLNRSGTAFQKTAKRIDLPFSRIYALHHCWSNPTKAVDAKRRDMRFIRILKLIDIAQATAELDTRRLKIVAPRAAANTAKMIAVAAA